jgi:drug/metabolite transporter (DMT)-like permease
MNFRSMNNDTVPMAIFCGLTAALIWGIWPVVSALGINQSLSALDLTALRLCVGGLVLLPLFWKLHLGFFGRGDLSSIAAILIVTGAGLPYVLAATFGLEFAPAGHFGVIAPSAQLVGSTLGSWLLLKERLNFSRCLAILVILFGVVLTGWEGLQNLGGYTWVGDLLFILAGFLWAIFTLSARYYSVKTFHAAPLILVWSMVLFLPIYLVFFESGILEASVSDIIFQGVFQGILTAVIALILFTRAISIIGAGRAAIFPTLVPGIAVLLAIPVLNEYPTTLELIGVLVVSVGMMLALGLFDRLFRRC